MPREGHAPFATPFRREQRAWLVHVVVPLSLGFLTYAVCRPSFALLSRALVPNHWLTRFLVFQGADAVWSYSFTACLGLLWPSRSSTRALWLGTALAVGVGLEAGQYFGVVEGTFDWLDVMVIAMAWAVAVFNTQRNEAR
jgi:hypothetical protein